MKTTCHITNKFHSKQTLEIIYDIDNVKQHKEEFDKKVADFDVWESKEHKKRVCIGIGLIVLYIVTLILLSVTGLNYIKYGILIGIAISVPVAISETCWNFRRDAMEPNRKYTPDIEYFLATKNKKTLNININPHLEHLPSLSLDIENEDHSIDRKEFCFKVIKRTDLKQVILNVNEGVIYMPYEL